MRDSKGRFLKGFKRSEEFRRKQSEGLIGHITSEETKIKISLSQKGKKLSHTHKDRLSKAKTGKFAIQSNAWKSFRVKNKPLHQWIRKHHPPPKLCGFCNQENKLHLANMTGLYNRDFNNWKYLCARCHSHYDRNIIDMNRIPKVY